MSDRNPSKITISNDVRIIIFNGLQDIICLLVQSILNAWVGANSIKTCMDTIKYSIKHLSDQEVSNSGG